MCNLISIYVIGVTLRHQHKVPKSVLYTVIYLLTSRLVPPVHRCSRQAPNDLIDRVVIQDGHSSYQRDRYEAMCVSYVITSM